LLLRMVRPLGDDDAPVLRVAGTYTLLRSTERTPTAVNAMTTCVRRDVQLTPRATVGLDAMLEQEGRRRVGMELYYTGRQTLEDNPVRPTSRPYLVVGLLVEQTFRTAVGSARVFVNGENFTNVRQTRFNPMLLPSRGRGGRWSTDAWTEVTGAALNAGVRLSFSSLPAVPSRRSSLARARRRVAPGTNAGWTNYLPDMKVLGRISLIVGFLALQLTSLAGGPGCTLPIGESEATGSGASGMRGMVMIPTPESEAPDSPREHAPAPVQACTTMAPCVFASAAAFDDSPMTLIHVPRSMIVTVGEAAPADAILAPETPPPQA